MIRLTAFRWVPPFAAGLVRDLRVRWALEEAGIAYEERLIGQGDQDSPDYRAMQPFGQVPVLEEDGLTLFESGAILLHIGEKSDVLLPRDPAARGHAIQWIFAAINSIEPHVQNLSLIDLFYPNEEWAKLRRPGAEQMVEKRLDSLAGRLGSRDYLDSDVFTAGDLMMTTVLRILRHTDLVARRPALAAYQQRCESRPAFQKALAAQLAPFAENAPTAQAAE
ncbi:glutathione S-transferase family protein [Allosphingosinicella deserti]|uniref:Glutathione S-transferase n=1 Tax=Allosphingosinicella deserti TaxID=2116704 RepID=A0A2P7QV40_9SPHN|nr:glutathione S-transferase family protein [Sphingomonas deserti]PSJ41836.1 glutathione S-transferase [Sphingomonas deserti]